MIYLIDFKTCYKIGRTNNLTQRLKTFKNSREDLEFISLIAFPDKIVLQEIYDQNGETYLHNKLKNFNIKNELFSRDPQVLSEFLNYKYNIVKDMVDWVELYYNSIQDNKQKSDNTIYQYNIDGVLLNTYKSGAEASKLTGTCYRSIIKVLNGERKSANNFIWSKRLLSEEELLLKINNPKNKHGTKIIQMDLNDNFIAEYKSLTEASKQTGINISCISNNIAGRTKRAGNFHWKYN